MGPIALFVIPLSRTGGAAGALSALGRVMAARPVRFASAKAARQARSSTSYICQSSWPGIPRSRAIGPTRSAARRMPPSSCHTLTITRPVSVRAIVEEMRPFAAALSLTTGPSSSRAILSSSSGSPLNLNIVRIAIEASSRVVLSARRSYRSPARAMGALSRPLRWAPGASGGPPSGGIGHALGAARGLARAAVPRRGLCRRGDEVVRRRVDEVGVEGDYALARDAGVAQPPAAELLARARDRVRPRVDLLGPGVGCVLPHHQCDLPDGGIAQVGELIGQGAYEPGGAAVDQ